MDIPARGFRLVPTSLREASHATTFVALVLGLAIAWAGYQFGLRLIYEAQGPFTADTPIYLAVGRGILNGLAPWADLFETKPPGIFLLSAASLALTGDEWLLHGLQVVALVLIAASPLLLMAGHGEQASRMDRWLLRALLLLLGLLLAGYAAERAGEVQVESFGAAAAALALLTMASPYAGRWPGTAVALGTLGWLGACGLKEPFVFPLLGAAVLLLRTPREWLLRCVLPLGLAALIGITLLWCAGWLHSYLNEYLPFMTAHAARSGPPWRRAMEVAHIWTDMNDFAPALGWAVCVLPPAVVALACEQATRHEEISAMVLRTGVMVLAAALAVGMGGEYYNHHHVFAIPAVLALVAALIPLILARHEGCARLVWPALTALLCVATLGLPLQDYAGRLAGAAVDRATARAEAHYVDAVLDHAQLQRYLFVGQNGAQLYAYTRHSPLGSMFFQLDEFAVRRRLQMAYFKALRTAQVVVVDHPADALAEPTQAILESDFTTTPWPGLERTTPDAPRYTIWFRRRDGAAAAR